MERNVGFLCSRKGNGTNLRDVKTTVVMEFSCFPLVQLIASGVQLASRVLNAFKVHPFFSQSLILCGIVLNDCGILFFIVIKGVGLGALADGVVAFPRFTRSQSRLIAIFRALAFESGMSSRFGSPPFGGVHTRSPSRINRRTSVKSLQLG